MARSAPQVGQRIRPTTAGRRKSSTQRGYDRRWREIRRIKLQINPICEDCDARDIATPADEVHHRRKISEAPHLRLDLSNLMALCKSCHAIRTARGE